MMMHVSMSWLFFVLWSLVLGFKNDAMIGLNGTTPHFLRGLREEESSSQASGSSRIIADAIATGSSLVMNHSDDTLRFQHHRSLVSPHNFFTRLACNTPVCNVKRSSWTAEAYKPNSGTVVIPCGHCITLDYDSNPSNKFTLVLPFGIDIQGTLRISGYTSTPLTIITPFVRVQGKLIMDTSRNMVGSEPKVKILLTDSNSGGPSSSTSFVPARENSYACSERNSGTPTSCVVGSKPIVVAGGELDIQGLPIGCATWVKLYDVVKISKLPAPNQYSTIAPQHPNIFCRINSGTPLMQQTFLPGSPYIDEWTPYFTGSVVVSGSLMSTGRRDDGKDGIAWDLGRLRSCIRPGLTYLFSFRVKFNAPIADGTPTACARTNKNCLRLVSIARFDSGAVTSNKGMERMTDSFAYGEWNTYHTSFQFGENELSPSPIFHKLVISGPEVSVDIEIDDVTFTLVQTNLLPNPSDVCGGNLILNGDAKANAVDPYPMDIVGDGRLSVMKDSILGDSFFRMEKRNSNTDSIAQFLDAPGCIVPGARYNVKAEIRVRSFDVPSSSIMSFRTIFLDGSSLRIVAAECPSSKNTWITCTSTFSIPFDFKSDQVASIRFEFETLTSPVADLDVTNWRLEFVDVTQSAIIVKEQGVLGCWGDGAEILITSSTTDFESTRQRRIIGDPVQYATGLMLLKLDGFVPPSVTELDRDGFAAEVALLSRNIAFEGARDRFDPLMGGHLIVLSTPTIPQLIQGVEFQNFGRQGMISLDC